MEVAIDFHSMGICFPPFLGISSFLGCSFWLLACKSVKVQSLTLNILFILFSESEQANELCQDYEHNLEALRGVSVSSVQQWNVVGSCPLGKISLNITVHLIHDNYISINNCGRGLGLCDVTQPRIWERLDLKKGVLFIWIKKKTLMWIIIIIGWLCTHTANTNLCSNNM